MMIDLMMAGTIDGMTKNGVRNHRVSGWLIKQLRQTIYCVKLELSKNSIDTEEDAYGRKISRPSFDEEPESKN